MGKSSVRARISKSLPPGPATSGDVKYLAISREIAGLINRGELAPGNRTPSENQIISSYGVSNTTARKVLARLESEGLVERIKGRGTFVRELPVFRPATEILSFSENMRRAGLVPSTELLGIERLGGGASLAVGGALHNLEGAFYLLRRLRYGGEFPVMLETRRISAEAVRDLDDEDLTASLYEIYRRRGILLTRIHQAFRPVILDQEVLDRFGLSSPAAGMLLEGASYDSTGRLLELERSFYRGDRYQFLVSAGHQTASAGSDDDSPGH